MLTTLGIFLSSNSQTKDNQVSNKNESLLVLNKKQETMEIDIFSDYAKKNNYKIISKEEFTKRCLDFFGINILDIDKENYIEINSNSGYLLSAEKQFLRTEAEGLFYNPSLDVPVSKDYAIKELNNRENRIGEKFLAYNKLLFNDDLVTLSYFINNPEIIEIVIDFDYEKSIHFFNMAIEMFKKENFIMENFNNHYLFYNNKNKGYKKDLLNNIYLRSNNNFEQINNSLVALSYNFSKAFKKIPIYQKTKDECAIYIIQLLNRFDKKNKINIGSINDQLAYVQLKNFLKSDYDFENRLKLSNYYNDTEIKELVENYNILKLDDVSETFFKINDPDGYTNLRKYQNTSSEILQRIVSGSEIEVLDNSGDWWLVETREGKRGYVHKTRIKAE
ncbi:SH3 domain-containing protein [Flavobacterium hercynium]|nr:SH3 domain-containing protein [Flavobacterium hercynium]